MHAAQTQGFTNGHKGATTNKRKFQTILSAHKKHCTAIGLFVEVAAEGRYLISW